MPDTRTIYTKPLLLIDPDYIMTFIWCYTIKTKTYGLLLEIVYNYIRFVYFAVMVLMLFCCHYKIRTLMKFSVGE